MKTSDSIDWSFLIAYPCLVAAEIAFSLFTWIFFCAGIGLIVINVIDNVVRKTLISIVGVGLTVLTFYLFCRIWELPFDSFVLTLAAANALLITLGSWYFNIEPKIATSISSINSNEN